ncbi:MAG: alanine--glyoxylate aminotransferase family protein [Proteobacteria bacterium]|nr:alanine--glyoxylate aminotransferase family protein [Pseudomonadota bacterium]
MDDYSGHYCLMCPGPVNVSQRVMQAMIGSEIGHREIEFSALLENIRRNCLKIMNLPETSYAMVVITGSGSAANEAVICSAIQPDDVVLSLATGEFGRRLGDISKIYNPNTVIHAQEWGTPLDLAWVEDYLRTHRVDWVTMVHNETCTGELQPVREVGALCKKYGAKLFVDAVSSFMADPLDLVDCNVTFMSTSSGKAIGMAPGLSLVVGKIDAFEALTHYPVRNYYLSLARHYDFFVNKRQTPNTPAIALFIALNEALRMILEEGIQERLAFQAQKAAQFRNGICSLGLSLLHPDHVLSNAVSTVILPEHTGFSELREALRSRNFIVYGGKGPLMDKVFQVSTMGHVDLNDVNALIDALRDILADHLHSVA